MSKTLFDVSKKAGVSTATVSRVINGSPLVVDETRDRVLKVIQELGYEPSHAARVLATNKTEIIGALFPDMDSGFFSDILRGLDEEAWKSGYHLMTSFAHGVEDCVRLITRLGYGRRVDALVLLNLEVPNDLVEKLSKQDFPVVMLDRPAANDQLFSVTIDNTSASAELTRHMIEHHGYQSFIVLAGPKGTYDAEERLKASQMVFRQHQLPENQVEIFYGDFTEAGGAAQMQDWFTRHPDAASLPDAIIAHNDAMALGALEILKMKNIRVPEDTALVGFDDINAARHVGLSSVHVDMFDMGKQAAHAAIQQIKGETGASNILQSARFVPRRSCGCS